tara:strand:+ start:3417 stop:3830 length:414 start_codon:yes stop_codon:yes gene_type:complete
MKVNTPPAHIGIDFDDTITVNPAMWLAIIEIMQKNGHPVTIVTIRHKNDPCNPEIEAFADLAGIPYVATEGKQKAAFMDAEGRHVDIWIDDSPSLIPAGKELKGTLLGCLRAGEPVDPEREIEATFIVNTKDKTFQA